ncbi:MAG: TRAM domain-containing protein [Nanoarchaeota archaeon]
MYENNKFGGDEQSAPVNVGEELDVTIEAVGEKGDGIAKKSGFVLFVPNVNEGDRVKIKVNKVLKKVGFADVVGEASTQEATQQKEKKVEEIEISEEDMANDSEDFGEEVEGESEEDMDEEEMGENEEAIDEREMETSKDNMDEMVDNENMEAIDESEEEMK